MKGFLVVDRINDVHFIDADNDFTEHINCQAEENGLLQATESHNSSLDPNVVMQLFSPLFMSQWFLIEQKKDPCSSISCENGFIFAFKQHEDFLIVAINGDGTETEQLLNKKISVFIRMSEFSFGPVIDEIGRCRFAQRADRWEFLRGVLSTWSTLRAKEHSFLVEAIERLHVNILVNEKCMELLEHAITKFQAAGEKNTQHAMLVANNKLLSLYSNRSAQSLKESDMLCIILLVKLLFPSKEKLEDFFSSTSRRSGSEEKISSPAAISVTPPIEKYESAPEGDESMDDADDQYVSAPDTPFKRTVPENAYPAVSEQPLEEESASQLTPQSISEDGGRRGVGRSRSRTLEDVHTRHVRSGRITPGTGRARSKSMNDQGISIEDIEGENRSTPPFYTYKAPPKSPEPSSTPYHIRHTAFLTTDICQFSPHQLHFIEVFPGIVLVLFSEIPRSVHANSLCQLLRLLKDLLSGCKDKVQRSQGHVLYDIINILLDKLAGAMKRARGNLESILNDIRRRWDNPEFKTSLLIYLEQSSGTDIPPSIERSLTSLHKMVKELFLYLYLYPCEISQQLTEVVEGLCERSKAKLWDYKEYLAVKAQRNIVMTSYLDTLPGLIHFIYVDRKTNQLTAPSLNITTKSTDQDVDPTQLMKNKIWRITDWMYSKLASGITMVTAREGDYYFSYFLWFEDYQGHQLPVRENYQAGDISLQPGIMSGNFYKALKKHCFPNAIPGSVNCYELIMMHIGLVHTQYIARHCQKLASMLYEATDSSSISFVW